MTQIVSAEAYPEGVFGRQPKVAAFRSNLGSIATSIANRVAVAASPPQ